MDSGPTTNVISTAIKLTRNGLKRQVMERRGFHFNDAQFIDDIDGIRKELWVKAEILY